MNTDKRRFRISRGLPLINTDFFITRYYKLATAAHTPTLPSPSEGEEVQLLSVAICVYLCSSVIPIKYQCASVCALFHLLFLNTAEMFRLYGGWMIPTSVTIPWMKRAGVTSKAGL
jgi:hypothetical protein